MENLIYGVNYWIYKRPILRALYSSCWFKNYSVAKIICGWQGYIAVLNILKCKTFKIDTMQNNFTF